MAKKNETAAPVETPATEYVAPTSVEYGGFSVDISSISPKGIAYLLQYGFAKSIQDSVAGRKKELTEEKVKTGEDADGNPIYGTERAHTDEQVTEILRAEMAERVEAIKSGTVGTRGPSGPRATKEDSVRRKVTLEMFGNFLSKKGVAAPKDKDAKEAYIAKFAAHPSVAPQIEAEVARRLAATNIDIDL